MTQPDGNHGAYIDKRARELEVATRSNQERLESLVRQGVRVDPAVLSALRGEVLAETLLGDVRDVRRLSYECAVQHAIEKVLLQVESQVARARLTHGVVNAPPHLAN